MGAELAVHNEQPAPDAPKWLSQFSDVEVAFFDLDVGAWVIFGRAVVANMDGDKQYVAAKIFAANIPAAPGAPFPPGVIIDHVRLYVDGDTEHCLTAQVTLKSRQRKRISLACASFKGYARFGSLIAFKVDDITP
jgi:hypothetical protein